MNDFLDKNILDEVKFSISGEEADKRPLDGAIPKDVDPDSLPKQDSTKYGKLAAVSISGIGLTEKGVLTRVSFFDNLEANDKETYKDLVLTPEEASRLSLVYRKMSTGVNSVLPITCSPKCPYADRCPYLAMGKAPIGKPCKLESDLLNYHTARFINEFNVDPNDHSEIMLIQELSELIILEMRVSMVLAKPENSSMFGVKISIAADGTPIEEEVEHWAFGVKEKIKNRRLKILEALNATRKAKANSKESNKDSDEDNPSKRNINKIIDYIEKQRRDNIDEAEFEEQ